MPRQTPRPVPPPPPPEETWLPDLLASAHAGLDQAMQALALPAAVEVLETELARNRAGSASVRSLPPPPAGWDARFEPEIRTR
jgi:hypothetical protein